MRAKERELARRQLDKRLKVLANINAFSTPPRGWIKAIREAMGMTAKQLGARLGVSQPRALKIEEAEVSGALTLNTLERAAQALNCQLVYVLVPEKPLEELTRERAERLARKQFQITGHSRTLEDQKVDAADQQAQIDALTREYLASSHSRLWDEE